MIRLRRVLAPLALALGLAVPVAHAQAPPPGADPNAPTGAAESGNPLYGYLGTAFLGAGVIFILCKSARR